VKCKKCITDEIWVKFLPEDILNRCFYCDEIGVQLTKVLKIAGTVTIFVYIVFFSIALL